MLTWDKKPNNDVLGQCQIKAVAYHACTVYSTTCKESNSISVSVMDSFVLLSAIEWADSWEQHVFSYSYLDTDSTL